MTITDAPAAGIEMEPQSLYPGFLRKYKQPVEIVLAKKRYAVKQT